MIYIFV